MSFHYKSTSHLLKQLIVDLKPVPERLNLDVEILEVGKKEIENFCDGNNDGEVFRKMMIHELIEEPAEKIVVIKQKNGEKIEKKYFMRLLSDLGYNVNVIFSKNHGSDFEAAINVNGYSIPGWELLIKLLRKLRTGWAVFWGKRFAPGRSRLHIRIFEGKRHWYVIAHIDTFNWINFNLGGVKKSHVGSGRGDYTNGTIYFIESLKKYFYS